MITEKGYLYGDDFGNRFRSPRNGGSVEGVHGFSFHKDPYFARTEEGSSKFEEWLRSLMKSDNALVLVAREDGQVIAYSLSQICKRHPLFKEVDYGYIYDLAVKSEYRRRGIGEQILGKILEWFKSRQIGRIELMVLAKNQIGYSFWKKHGFVVVAHRMFLGK